jgi:anion-transporting  ArsA/GET3 family ATPase
MQILIISGQSTLYQHAVALATACHAATQDMRVLVVGTGPRGMLGHLVGQSLESRPVELKENLAAMELVTLDEFSQRWEMLRSDAVKYGITGRLRDVGPDELPSFPGMDEMASLIVANRASQTGKFDLVVFGGTPIDSLLRGITMRETVRWLTRVITGLSRWPGASRTSQETAMMPASILNALSSTSLMQDLRVALEWYTLWFDSAIGTRVRLVLPADEMTLPFMRYAMNGCGLYSMDVDTIFVRGDSEQVDAAVRDDLKDMFIPLESFAAAPADLETWTTQGAALYRKHDGKINLPEQENDIPPLPKQAIERNEVRLHLPFLNSKELDISVASEEVFVRIGEFRRQLLMAGMEKGGNLRAKVDGKTLRLWVEDAQAQQSQQQQQQAKQANRS